MRYNWESLVGDTRATLTGAYGDKRSAATREIALGNIDRMDETFREFENECGRQQERLEDAVAAAKAREAEIIDKYEAPIPMRITCPMPTCGALHVDEGAFATKPHHTHSCQICGHTWRPAVVCTVGVRFLPGFKTEPPTSWTLAGDEKVSRSAAALIERDVKARQP